jgi:hypothetical protein
MCDAKKWGVGEALASVELGGNGGRGRPGKRNVGLAVNSGKVSDVLHSTLHILC